MQRVFGDEMGGQWELGIVREARLWKRDFSAGIEGLSFS